MVYERFDELFDPVSGGPLYVRDAGDGRFEVAGALWLDGGEDGRHYFAFVMGTCEGDEFDGAVVADRYSAAEAFRCATDASVAHEIGWFGNIGEAIDAVNLYAGSISR